MRLNVWQYMTEFIASSDRPVKRSTTDIATHWTNTRTRISQIENRRLSMKAIGRETGEEIAKGKTAAPE